MSKPLQAGITLFHRNGITGNVVSAQVLKVGNTHLMIRLAEKVGGKKTLILPLYTFGQYLFYSAEDCQESKEHLAVREEYLRFGNKELVELNRRLQTPPYLAKSALLGKLQREHRFQGFHHYTDFSNFLSIMDAGYLYSRNGALASKRLHCDAAHGDIIRNTREDFKNNVRFFYRPNTPTTYMNEGIKSCNSEPHMPIPVLLLFNDSLLFDEGVTFLNGCGGSDFSLATTCAKEAANFEWGKIFSSSISNKHERNAEFHYPEKVSTNKLQKVVFRAQADLKRARHFLGDSPLYTVDANSFWNRENYLKDYQIYRQAGKHFFQGVFSLYPTPDRYRHELDVWYEGGWQDKPQMFLSSNSVLRAELKPSFIRVEYKFNGFQSAFWEAKR